MTHNYPFKVLDFHVHFLVESAEGSTRASGGSADALTYSQRSYRWMLESWDFPTPETPIPPATTVLDRWINEIERYELDGMVFVTGAGANFMSAAQQQYPDRIYAFSHVSPDDPEALVKITQDVDQRGLRGLKMFGPRLQKPFEDRAYWPIWEFLAERHVPLLIHFGILGGGGGIVYHDRMNPLTVDPVARNFPTLPIVIPHFGTSYWGDLLQLGWANENIYVDTSGSNQWMRWMPYTVTLESLLRKAYETFGPHRIIFGTDSSYFPRGFAERYLLDLIRAARYNGMPDRDLQCILHTNAWHLLHPREGGLQE